jgi:hypothetical protein
MKPYRYEVWVVNKRTAEIVIKIPIKNDCFECTLNLQDKLAAILLPGYAIQIERYPL